MASGGIEAITEADLRRDLFALAGDAMRGREAGTLDELRASVWVAERAREAGLEPAGDDSTYFQWWPLRRTRVSDASRIAIAGRPQVLWRDAIVWSPINANLDQPLVWIGSASAAELASMDLTGKAVAAIVTAPSNPPGTNVSLREWRFANAAVAQRAALLAQRGAAAIVLVSGDAPELSAGFELAASTRMRGTYGIDSAGAPAGAFAAPSRAPGSSAASVPAIAPVPVVWLRADMLAAVRGPAARFAANLVVETYSYPSVNVVARVRGSDATLRGEHVLFSGHQDHDGVRAPLAGDSIRNGADDNATVSVALLAIGRAVSRQPLRRSALFVWHGAEERGLLGSRWYVAHPTVPKGSIVAVLNGDMFGRNHPDTAALLGVQPPHLNSRALVAAAYRANAMTARFAIDTSWDNPAHPEGWYFRSDHLPYARAGIPSVFFTTLLHPDYHTPRDGPETIDITKLAKVTRWMYATGWLVGDAAARPDVVPGFQLER